MVVCSDYPPLSFHIGRHLQDDPASDTWCWVGVGVGVASIAVGATETTDLSGGVAVAGVLSTVLGVMQLTRHADADAPPGGGDVLARSLSFSPLVTSSEKSGMGFGILTRVGF